MTTSGTATRAHPRARRPSELARAVTGRRRWPPLQVSLLLVSLVMPWVFSIGDLAVSPYRLVLLALMLPCLVQWLSGKAGSVRAADILLLLFCIWCSIALGVVHGADQGLKSGGMLFIETFGAYLVARCYIRSIEDFQATAKLLLILVALLLPLALAEAVTGQRWTLHLFRTLGPTIVDGGTEPRWGLTRVQGPFEHPILFGVFCGAPLALVYLAYGQELGLLRRWAMTALIVLTAMLSLSTGPILAVAVQLCLLAWDGMLRKFVVRWRVLWGLVIISYLALELPSSQTVPQMLTRFAFDPWTAFYRILIFNYGWSSVMANPLFGTGFNDWLHPAWMTSSIDMFWLVPAIRHGLPGGALCLAAFFAAFVGVGLQGGLDAKRLNCRTAYLVVMTGFFVAGWTVHFWNATYVLFMFLLGSGLWLYDAPRTSADAAEAPQGARRREMQRSRAHANQRPARPALRRHAREH